VIVKPVDLRDDLTCRHRGLVGQAQDDDPGVAAGRVATDVREAAIEREQQTPSAGGCSDDVCVAGATQILGGDGFDVLPRSASTFAAERGRFSSSLILTGWAEAGRGLPAPASPRTPQPRAPPRL
jgi:hypothetical protein